MTKTRKTSKAAKPHCRKLNKSDAKMTSGYCVMHNGEPHYSFDKQGRSLKNTKKTFVNVKGTLAMHYH